jgi:hypothetical protein
MDGFLLPDDGKPKETTPMTAHDLTDFEAVAIAEGNLDMIDRPMTPELADEAWQHLIDTGLCWQLQGRFGRQASARIAAGINFPAS